MRKVLFLITELQRPVGGLYRFAVEYLPVWRKAFEEKETNFEPLVFAPRDVSAPLGDLVIEPEFKDIAETHNVKIYSAVRGNVKCYFLESTLNENELFDFHHTLWEKYRIKSEKASSYYNKILCPFWNHMPEVAKSVENIILIDAQDWLSFPGGFLVKESIEKPLICRFHSGEFGRAMGKPDMENAPARIEAAALYEADYVVGVSVPEMKFEITNLLPFSGRLSSELKQQRGREWYNYQLWKQREYRRFLFFDSDKMHLIGKNAAGIPNGIILDGWKKIKKEEILKAKDLLRRNFPTKDKIMLFIGRTERRKGLPPLLEALRKLKYEYHQNVGLVIASVMNDERTEYENKIREMGIENDVVIDSRWLSEKEKMALLCAPDILALPSLYEPFGLVTLEGLAADLACEQNHLTGPVVVTGDIGGMKDIMRSGIDGFKVPVENFSIEPELLASVTAMIMEHPELHKRLSVSGAKRVEDDIFKWENTLRHTLRIYEKAIQNYSKWESE